MLSNYLPVQAEIQKQTRTMSVNKSRTEQKAIACTRAANQCKQSTKNHRQRGYEGASRVCRQQGGGPWATWLRGVGNLWGGVDNASSHKGETKQEARTQP